MLEGKELMDLIARFEANPNEMPPSRGPVELPVVAHSPGDGVIIAPDPEPPLQHDLSN